ncbi:MAG: hypothetical protein CL908_21025 [Deltaproteobacteria bacterium]|nr:hypothetical protein [Deltaproteobacteria bacterium]
MAAAIELAHGIARQIEAGWPDETGKLDPPLLALAERLGVAPERLCDVAAEAEASFETLSKLS